MRQNQQGKIIAKHESLKSHMIFQCLGLVILMWSFIKRVILEIEIIHFRKIQPQLSENQTPCTDESFTSLLLIVYCEALLKLSGLISGLYKTI